MNFGLFSRKFTVVEQSLFNADWVTYASKIQQMKKGDKYVSNRENEYANLNIAESHIESIMYGFMASSVLFVGDELGIYDLLAKSEAVSIEEAAALTLVSKSEIERLLIAACSVGLIEREDATYFTMHEHMKPLFCKADSRYCGSRFKHYFTQTAPLFQFLPEALREGGNQWHRLMSKDGERAAPFDNVYSCPEQTRIFLESMWELGYRCSQELVKKFDMNRFNQLVDLGGATGSFLVAAVEEFPDMVGCVYDLEVVEPYFNEKRKKHGLEDQIKFVGGDLFVDNFPLADAYSLGYILSDWSKEKGDNLLRKIYKHLPAGGAVIVLEKLFNEQKDGPLATAMMNLVMLLEMEGQHHTSSEYFERLHGAGFEDMVCYRSSGEKHMIVGFKPHIL